MPAAPLKQKLNDQLVRRITPQHKVFLVWDTYQRGLAIAVQPTGQKSYKCIYRANKKPRWYHIADCRDFGVDRARLAAGAIMFDVAQGKDPLAERIAQRSKGTFAELAARYVKEYAKRKNKSWQRTEVLVRKYLLPKLGNLHAESVTRADIKQIMVALEDTPILANRIKAAAGAIFTWGIKEGILKINPCQLINSNETQSRERVLSAPELPLFWSAFDDAGLMQGTALKMVLLTGQRPGEIRHMRREHIVDGWWQMPGQAVPALGWPGTKNGASHRVWLPAAAQALIKELDEEATTGFVFPASRGKAQGQLHASMRSICAKLGVTDPVKPHDLRRTHGTMITKLKFGRDAMNRMQNHKEGGIADVYDRYGYEEENKKIMETVAERLLALANGETGKVLNIRRA